MINMKCKNCLNETANSHGICAQCELHEKQIESMEDDFYDDEYDDDPQEPDYWECHGCMKSYGRRPMGGMCDSCGSYVEEGYW